MSENNVVNASEIGEYVYCNHAWWLRRVQGYAPTHVRELAQGTAHHEVHGRAVGRALTLQKIGIALLLAGAATLVLWFLGG